MQSKISKGVDGLLDVKLIKQIVMVGFFGNEFDSHECVLEDFLAVILDRKHNSDVRVI
jgi:hypothetical protein